MPDGTYHLRARVSDLAGNEGQSAVSTMVVATSASGHLDATCGDRRGGYRQRLAGPLHRVRPWQLHGHDRLGRRHARDVGRHGTRTAAGYIVQHDPSDLSQGFDVIAGHTYVEELSGATFNVQVTDGTTTISKSTTFSVADQQLINLVVVPAKVPTTAQRGVLLAAITGLATFTDPAGLGNETPADFTATINWGDGFTSAGTVVSLGGGDYQVDAPSYTYVHSGLLSISVTVKHDALPPVTSPSLPITVGSSLPIVVSTTPSIADGSLPFQTNVLNVNFNVAVVNANNVANYVLQSVGPDGLLGTADDLIVPIATVGYSDTPTHTAVLFIPSLPEGVYRLTVLDNITGGGVKIDGNDDGTAGGSWVRDFVVVSNDPWNPEADVWWRISTSSVSTGRANPRAIATGDFNGDGRLDLAVTNYNATGTVGIFLGNGVGGFAAPVLYNSGTAVDGLPTAVAVGDFNGDNRLDLAVTNSSNNTIGILTGKGDGTFNAATSISSGTGTNPMAVVAADFNGDMHLDLAVANYGTNTVGVFLGNGDGTFAAPANLGTGGYWPDALAVADFNGDGRAISP